MKKNEAIEYYGGVIQLAAALGIKPQSVSQWGELIPEGRAYKIEVLTDGHLKVNKADYATPANTTAGPQGPALEQ